MKRIAPSILSADFSILGEEIQAVETAGADWIHIDVMDAHFVPNLTYGPIIVKAVRKVTSLPLDVHLMIEKPDLLIPDFVKAGADWITVHQEACIHLNRSIQLIKSFNVRAGVALNPATSLETLDWILEELDYVLLMTVNPGFGGQAFIPQSLEKIRRLRGIMEERGLDLLIQVDGGINLKTVGEVSRAGADCFVAGSAIFGTDDYTQTIDQLRRTMA
jgi:ribulose-phosphate 3-epimerase